MWKLEHLTNNTSIFLQQGCEQAVSRQDGCWLQLTEDASISRKHALLRVQHSLQAVKRNVVSILELQDVNAKNGTYVKPVYDGDGAVEFTEADRLQAGTTVTLKHGDIVRFGLYKYCYRVVRCPLVVATSMLAAADTEAVLAALLLLGATFSKDWTDECTHLVMDSIKLSAKVSCALAYGAAIVTPAFLTVLCSAVKKKESVLPPHLSFMPPITEPGIQPNPSLFERNVERRRVLSGLRFLFASQRTSKRLSSIVLSAGGCCGLLSSRDHATLAAGQALLVRGMEDGAASASQGSPFTAALGVVQRAGLNPVPESDIALAVLYCSTERFCNPTLSQQNLVAPTVPQSQQESLVVFAPGTESFSASPPPSRSSAATPTRTTVVTAHGAAAVVPDTPASTASGRTDTAASKLSCRSTKAAEMNRTGKTFGIQEEDGTRAVDASALRGGVSLDATSSLSLSSPSRPVEDSPRQSKLARKRVRHGGSSASSAEEGAPAPKRSTAAAPIEPTQEIALSQDDDRTVPFGYFGDITGLEMGQFAPKDTSTQKMEEEAIPQPKSVDRVHVQTVVGDTGNISSGNTVREFAAQRASRRTREVVTAIPPTPTPPLSQHFPSSISVPPTPTPPQSHQSRDINPPASLFCAVAAATSHIAPSLSPDKGRVEQRKQQQRRETITLSTLPSLPAETYADTSLFPGISDEPPPTLDPPSLPDAEWLPAARRRLAVVNDANSGRRSLIRDEDVSAILDPPPGSAGTNSRADGPIKVERSESRDANVFQMPTANVRQRKTKQTPAVLLPNADASTTVAMLSVGGIKRSRSTEEREVIEQEAVEPTSRRIKCEPELQPESAEKEPPVPPMPVVAPQGFLSKPSRANSCNNTTVGLNCTSAALTGASGPANATSVSSRKAADEDNKVVKPDLEVTRISRAVMVSLVLRTSILGDQYSPPSNNTTVSGKINFKLFKKVTRFSSDRNSQAMPRIIGGRDLKPHTAFYTETDADLRTIERLQSLRATWLSQHPDASSYLDQEERDRQERLRDDWGDDTDERNTGRGGGRGRGSSMMSYLTTAGSGSVGCRSAPGPSTDASGLPVFCMPVANVRKRPRR